MAEGVAMIDEQFGLLSDLLCRIRQNGLMSDLPFDVLRNEEDAWLVQADANACFSSDAVGYAIVGSGDVIRSSLGISRPIYTTIPIGTYHQDFGSQYRLPRGFIGAQCQLVFTMGASLGADQRSVTREQFCDAVLSTQPSIGLIGRRGHLSRQPSLAAIADFSLHVATLVGKHHQSASLETVDRMDVRALINGGLIFQARSNENLIDPIDSALWFVNDLINRHGHVSTGDIVATGSIIPVLLQIVPGQELTVEISEIGSISASFV